MDETDRPVVVVGTFTWGYKECSCVLRFRMVRSQDVLRSRMAESQEKMGPLYIKALSPRGFTPTPFSRGTEKDSGPDPNPLLWSFPESVSRPEVGAETKSDRYSGTRSMTSESPGVKGGASCPDSEGREQRVSTIIGFPGPWGGS